MPSPTASELLAAWERGVWATASERGLLLVRLARPELGDSECDALTVGQRDAALLDLRERVFGTAIDGVAACSECGELLDLTTSVDELRLDTQATPAFDLVTHDAHELRFRHPSAGDLAAIAHEADVASARTRLLERCVLEATRAGAAVTVEELPEEAIGALGAAMADADAQADLELAISCPACGHSATLRFDIASFLWHELDSWARRTLNEIHLLASAYGWSETEILALGVRRRLYLEFVEA
jgi:hypothetical protein